MGCLRRPGGFQDDEGGRGAGVRIRSSTPISLPPTRSGAKQDPAPDNQGEGSSSVGGGLGKGGSVPHSYVLLSSLLGSEGERLEDDNRSSFPQSLLKAFPLQDVNGSKGWRSHPRSQVGSHSGLGKCLPQHPSSARLSKVPRFPTGNYLRSGEELRLHSAPFRPFTGSIPLQSSYEASQDPFRPSGNLEFGLSGRFPLPGRITRGFDQEAGLRPVIARVLATPNQCEEVRSDSFTEGNLSRSNFQLGHTPFFNSRGEDSKNQIYGVPNADVPLVLPQETRGSYRVPELCCRLSSPRKTSSQALDPLAQLPYVSSLTGSQGTLGLFLQEPSRSVAVRRASLLSNSYEAAPSGAVLDDRRFRRGLGRGSSTTLSGRGLVLQDSVPVRHRHSLYKHPRAASGSVFSGEVGSSPERESCSAPDRQHNSSFLHLPSRFLCSRTNGIDGSSSGVLLESRDNSSAQTSVRETESPGRSGIKIVSSGIRVDSGSRDVSLDLEQLRSLPNRSFRNQMECSASKVHLPLSGPKGGGGQCSIGELEQVGQDISLSPCGSPAGGSGSPPALQRSGSVDRSFLPPSPLVSPPAGKGSRPNPSSHIPFFMAGNLQRDRQARETRALASSRLETIKRGLIKKGISPEARTTLLGYNRESTIKQYQYVWNLFWSYTRNLNIKDSDISIATLVNFLEFIRVEGKGRKHATLTSYVSALKLPLLLGFNVHVRDILSDTYLQGVYQSEPSGRARARPSWDLNILLRFLDSGIFEPLENAPFIRVTQKTLCLLFLATGRRKTDILNLSRRYHKVGVSSRTSLCWLLSYIPKNQRQSFTPELPSLDRFPSGSDPPNSLCPRRALKIYLRVSRREAESRGLPLRSLWVPLKGRAKVMTKRKLAELFKSVVSDSYVMLDLAKPDPVFPHQMRSLAASYPVWAGQDPELVRTRLGLFSMKVLLEHNVDEISDLEVACVLPGGPFFPPER